MAEKSAVKHIDKSKIKQNLRVGLNNKQFGITNLTKIDEAGDENNYDDESKRVKQLEEDSFYEENIPESDMSMTEKVINNIEDFFKKINCKIIKSDDSTML